MLKQITIQYLETYKICDVTGMHCLDQYKGNK